MMVRANTKTNHAHCNTSLSSVFNNSKAQLMVSYYMLMCDPCSHYALIHGLVPIGFENKFKQNVEGLLRDSTELNNITFKSNTQELLVCLYFKSHTFMTSP